MPIFFKSVFFLVIPINNFNPVKSERRVSGLPGDTGYQTRAFPKLEVGFTDLPLADLLVFAY